MFKNRCKRAQERGETGGALGESEGRPVLSRCAPGRSEEPKELALLSQLRIQPLSTHP